MRSTELWPHPRHPDEGWDASTAMNGCLRAVTELGGSPGTASGVAGALLWPLTRRRWHKVRCDAWRSALARGDHGPQHLDEARDASRAVNG